MTQDPILEALLALRAAVKKGETNGSYGICWHLTVPSVSNPIAQYVDIRSRMWAQEVWCAWPGYSRNEIYPVPATDMKYAGKRYGPEEQYYAAVESESMWRGYYGKKRRALLSWLIKERRRELKEAD